MNLIAKPPETGSSDSQRFDNYRGGVGTPHSKEMASHG